MYMRNQTKKKVNDEFISVIDFSIKNFLARFSHFKELSETLKFILSTLMRFHLINSTCSNSIGWKWRV